MLSPHSVPSALPGAEGSRLGADFVILDGAGRTLRGLNATGARVWELIDGRRSVEEIAREVALEFSAPEEPVLRDVLAFLELLRTKGLIEERARPAALRMEGSR